MQMTAQRTVRTPLKLPAAKQHRLIGRLDRDRHVATEALGKPVLGLGWHRTKVSLPDQIQRFDRRGRSRGFGVWFGRSPADMLSCGNQVGLCE